MRNAGTAKKPDPKRKPVRGKVTGTVKFYNVQKKYGFITRSDTKKEVFVHQTGISNRNTKWLSGRSLRDGELVSLGLSRKDVSLLGQGDGDVSSLRGQS